MDPISTDGNCGSNSDTNTTCLTSEFGNCCSSKGFCGGTSAYCGEGCQTAFGKCCQSSFGSCDSTKPSSSVSWSATPSNPENVSKDGNCGSNSMTNATCLKSKYGACCSSHGFCGGNASYCGTGCQSKYGSCSIATIPAVPTPSLASVSTVSSLSKGAIAGISIGAGAFGCAMLGLLMWSLFARKRRYSTNVDIKPISKSDGFTNEMDGRGISIPVELPTSK
ncbi:hypothetical protein P175DRAFT_0514359 [Aspergillus ochraceoroseus IBT 24754]|uniref:Chitin-binding type-1 domain-containing protein n=1 Tax=Aspergillus ochraceoroseus IBT 24754 TaxID=1392256 RepID=A0A2T5MAX4_9EURO|nr:uncharacterized protein P175DRAFT_0514359 [Aspergillus ochraceoroseus IBT 24754]PTU25686.1 hypothetical protein P175DRAFT_0514359 [Aspergillus ochraceoroseus IBT 24754]